MPKGVEHKKLTSLFLAALLVRIPMMPKGVEHLFPVVPEAVIESENSDDAERR